MPHYSSVAELPAGALGSNKKPRLMFSPFDLDAATITAAPLKGRRIENLPVFRTGNLKDSKGNRAEWSRSDLDEMVTNFNALKANKVLMDVPVRTDHTRSVKDVVGYYVALRRIDDVLYADIELTEPAAAEKYDRGTYRSRSIEIGAYESNTGDIYYPAVLGLAFCDIPAVEGLFTKALSGYSDGDTEIQVFAAETAPSPDGENGPDSLAEDFTTVLEELHQAAQKLAGNPQAHAAVQKVIQATEAIRNSVIAVAAPPATPAAPASATHQREHTNMESFTFALDGTDYEVAGDESTKRVFDAFAASLATTRQALTETQTALTQVGAERATEKETARVAAVDTWLSAKKITPAQVDAMKAYVKTLGDEQFTAHAALVMGAPDLALTVDHSNPSEPTAEEAKTAKVREHRNTLEMLKFSGALTPEALRNSKAAKALIALGETVEV